MSIRVFLSLIKFAISFFVGLSAFAGSVMFSHEIGLPALLSFFGVFVLAAGCSVLNQYQEHRYDLAMERTRLRPIPSGKVSPRLALIISIIMLIAGSVILSFAGIPALALGLFNVLWYNGLYTYLKRITPFAVVPGSLIGAIPPMIGWSAAGGSLDHPFILLVALFVFIWQIPHFWLLLFRHGEDYEKAGFASMTALFSIQQLKNITVVWIVTSAVFSLFFPLFHQFEWKATAYILIALSVAMMIGGMRFWFTQNVLRWYRSCFMGLNIYFLLCMVFLATDSLFA